MELIFFNIHFCPKAEERKACGKLFFIYISIVIWPTRGIWDIFSHQGQCIRKYMNVYKVT